MEYKKCFLPTCGNDSINSPNKIIAKIREDLREQWCKQANVEYYKIYTMYCCEDHFIPQKDLKNYYTYKKTKLNPSFLPTAKLRYFTSVPSEQVPIVPSEPLLVERKSTEPKEVPKKQAPIKPKLSMKRMSTSGPTPARPGKKRLRTKSLKDYVRSCRCCLVKKGPMKPIFGSGIDVLLTELLHLEVKPNDGYPQRVCTQCIRKLRSLHIFYLTTKNSRKFLDQVAEVDDGPLSKRRKMKKLKQDNETGKVSVQCQTEKYLFKERKRAEELLDARGASKCSQCTRHRQEFKAHLESHGNGAALGDDPSDFPYLCDCCGKTFRWRTTLVTHMRYHQVDGPEQEPLATPKPAQVKTENASRVTYDCPRCNRVFGHRTGLARHARRVHAAVRSLHPCGDCERNFFSSYGLQKHQLRLHTPSRCNRCHAKFSGVTLLEQHMRTHKECQLEAPASDADDTDSPSVDHTYATYIQILESS